MNYTLLRTLPRKAPEKRNFLTLKSHFSVAKPQKDPANVLPKAEKRKQKQPASIEAILILNFF